MKALVFEPFSGASGDMIVGSLLDLGVKVSTIADAISAVKNHTIEPDLPIPATNEAILICIDNLKT